MMCSNAYASMQALCQAGAPLIIEALAQSESAWQWRPMASHPTATYYMWALARADKVKDMWELWHGSCSLTVQAG